MLGKTILASSLIEAVSSLPSTRCLYFYCQNNDLERNSFIAIARSFLQQILPKDENLISYVYNICKERHGVHLTDAALAKELLNTCLEGVGAYIVIDGLDECPLPEQKEIVGWIRDFVGNTAPKSTPSRCVFLSQNDGMTQSLLSRFSTIKITHHDIRDDILAYCTDWARRIKLKFGLSEMEASVLANKTTENAQGTRGQLSLH